MKKNISKRIITAALTVALLSMQVPADVDVFGLSNIGY
jgi:hypothetical protein